LRVCIFYGAKKLHFYWIIKKRLQASLQLEKSLLSQASPMLLAFPAFLAPLFSVALAGVPAVLCLSLVSVSIAAAGRLALLPVLAFANVLGFAVDCVTCDPPCHYA
jgi:hypothetical protein